ncbi:hypothetical protein [Peribacillus sp. NPDC097295]|uniref:hypothetical protein n=1 Tax=Peribacillus sp. NPDC097295 TaxID=3364402 RepID=UPI0037F45C19
MKNWILVYVMLMMLVPSVVSAHVVNKENVYDDIQYSQAAEDVVLLSGMGIISYEHEDSLFHPQDKLTRKELAEWSVGFLSRLDQYRGVDSGEMKSSLLSSLEGNATYGDVGDAFFKGKLYLNDPDGEMTREEFVIFMARNLGIEIDGETLMEQAGLSPGPTGEVSQVEVGEDQTYKLDIGNNEYLMDAHPRVLNGAADPVLWKGKMIEESWISQTEDGPIMKQVKFGKGSVKGEKSIVVDKEEQGGIREHEQGKGFLVVPTVIACIVLIFLYVMFKRNKE